MVEEAVGSVTSFFRRFVMGALEHQHAPLPQDEDGVVRPYQFSGASATEQNPGWFSWFSSSQAPPGYGTYAPTLQSNSDMEMRRDEEYQVQEAMRRSRRDRGRYDDDRYGDRSDEDRRRPYDDDGYHRPRNDDDLTPEERERRDIEKALELSKKEAEEAERAKKEEEELRASAAPPPDLMSMEADLLGLGSDPLFASSSSGSTGGHQLIPYDPTANDEAIARTLNLLDNDFAPADDIMAKINDAKPKVAAEADLLALVDSPSLAAGSGGDLNSQSGALVLLNPNRPFRQPQASQGTCAGCQKKIDQGRFLNCLNKTWHPQCFKCKGCDLPISEREFKLHDGAAFHDKCYKIKYHPMCSVCADYIPPGVDGMIQFRTLPFWEDKSCLSHANDGTGQCTSCQRFEPKANPYVDLSDGRKLCLDCVGTMVVDSNDCLPLFVSVQEFFSQLGMPIRQEIPLLCVELQALNAAAAGEKGHQGHSVTRGLCLAEEHTIQSVVRLPGGGKGLPFGGIGQKVQTLTRHCEVTAILVLYGLPRLLTGQILAHELMHAWFRLDGGFGQLPPELEEGLCQVLAHLWLQSQMGNLQSEGPDSFQPKFAEFCMHQIAMDTTPVYGEGFRKAYTATVQHGLIQTVNHVRKTGQLPK